MASLMMKLPLELNEHICHYLELPDIVEYFMAVTPFNGTQVLVKALHDNLLKRCKINLNKTLEQRQHHFSVNKTVEVGSQKCDRGYLTPKMVLDLMALRLKDQQFHELLQQADALQSFHRNDQMMNAHLLEVLTATITKNIFFFKIEIEDSKNSLFDEYFVVPVIPSLDVKQTINLIQKKDLHLQWILLGAILVKHLSFSPDAAINTLDAIGFKHFFGDRKTKLSEEFIRNTTEEIVKTITCYKKRGKCPDLAIRNIHMGHIANSDNARSQYRPEFDGYGIMKDAMIFKEDLLNNCYDNFRMNQIYLINTFLIDRELILASLQNATVEDANI